MANGRVDRQLSREEIGDLIEALIAELDARDADPDFEPDADSEANGDEEPSLGWTDAQTRTATYGPSDDREVERDC
jgi:hypothetical protein